MASLNDHENRIRNLENQVNSGILNASTLFNAGGVNGLVLCILKWKTTYGNNDMGANSTLTYNSSSAFDLYYAKTSNAYATGDRDDAANVLELEPTTTIPYGTYKTLSMISSYTYTGHGDDVGCLVLCARVS